MGWISGWAVPESWFLTIVQTIWPQADHIVVTAGPDALDALERGGGGGRFDVVGGYSLGSHLLLANPERVGLMAVEVLLLAPVFAFVREEQLGGRGGRTHVRYLRRWLRTDRVAALRDFYLRAGLDIPLGEESESPDLDWGLEILERERIDPPAPVGWRLFCGDVDDLLDANQLDLVCGGLEIVSGAGHHPGGLLRTAARRLSSVQA